MRCRGAGSLAAGDQQRRGDEQGPGFGKHERVLVKNVAGSLLYRPGGMGGLSRRIGKGRRGGRGSGNRCGKSSHRTFFGSSLELVGGLAMLYKRFVTEGTKSRTQSL